MLNWIISLFYKSILRWYVLLDMGRRKIRNRDPHLVRIVQNGYLIKCYMTHSEQNMLKKALQNHRIIHILNKHSYKERNAPVIELTTDFNLFYYLCVHEKFPENFNIVLNEEDN